MNSNQVEDNSKRGGQAKKSLTFLTLSSLFWMFSSTAVQAVLRLLVLVILARLLTPEDYGEVGVALIIVNFAQLSSQLGMGAALVQRPTLEERHVRTAFTSFIFSSTLIGAAIAISAPLIAAFFRMDTLVPILRVAALAFPLQGLSVVPTALIRRELKFRYLARINVIAYFIGTGAVGIGLALLGFGRWALVGGLLAHLIIIVIVLLFVQPFPKTLKFDFPAYRELTYYGSGFTLGRLLNYFAGQSDNLVVGRWLGAEALGFYGRAYQMLVFPINLFGDAIDQVLFSSMARVQEDPKRLELAYRRGTTLTALMFLPMSVAVLLLAPEIILLMLGPAWEAVVVPFQILAAGMLFRANKMDHSIARSTGAVYKRAGRQAIYLLAVLLGAWIGQHWGVAGVAIGVTGAMLINFILMAHLSLTITSMTWRCFFALFWSPLLLGIVTFGLTWLTTTALRNLSLPAIVVLFGSGSITGLGLLIVVYLRPQLFLGHDGMWMLQTITNYVTQKQKLPGWVKRFVHKKHILPKKI